MKTSTAAFSGANSVAKLKIGLVVDDTLDKPDGVQQYVLLLGSWLTKQGHEVHYLAGKTRRDDISNIHSLARNIPVTYNKNRLTIPLPVSKWRMRRFLKKQKFDVLHVQMPYSPLLAGKIILAAPKTTAIIGTFHILPFSHRERKATRLLGKILRPSLKRFHRVIAVSWAASVFANEAFGVQPKVIPNMIDTAAFRGAAVTSDRFVIAFLGRLVPRKGAEELLRAVAAMSPSLRRKLWVRIAGKGPLLGHLQEYVREHNLEQIVSFEGFIPEDKKADFMASADIVAYPALGGESFGIVLIEAMAAGAGVTMGGNNPGYMSVLGEWPETVFDPQSTADFVEKLARLMGDDDLRKQLHTAQKAAVKQYDVSVVGTQILAEYESALAEIRPKPKA